MVILIFWVLTKSKVNISENQILEAKKENKPEPTPKMKDTSLKEQFKYRFYHKSDKELHNIIESNSFVPDAKKAAQELIDNRKKTKRAST